MNRIGPGWRVQFSTEIIHKINRVHINRIVHGFRLSEESNSVNFNIYNKNLKMDSILEFDEHEIKHIKRLFKGQDVTTGASLLSANDEAGPKQLRQMFI